MSAKKISNCDWKLTYFSEFFFAAWPALFGIRTTTAKTALIMGQSHSQTRPSKLAAFQT
jgi:hypothetical protein